MKPPLDVFRIEIAKLELQPGDVLVVKTDLHLDQTQAAGLRDMAQKIIGDDVKVMVLTGGITLEVLRTGNPTGE